MNSRISPVQAATSSRARSVQAYYPFYPPPVFPEGLEHGGYAGFSTVPGSYVDERTDKGIVRRNNLRMGDRSEYGWGGVIMRVFRMMATGQVQSSQYQRVVNMPNISQFNDFLYRAAKGYPRNLGLSEKVPTLPQNVLSPWNMEPRPQFTRNVFTRRNFTTAPSVPAKPQNR